MVTDLADILQYFVVCVCPKRKATEPSTPRVKLEGVARAITYWRSIRVADMSFLERALSEERRRAC